MSWGEGIRKAYFPQDRPNGATYSQFLTVMRMAALSIVADARTQHRIEDPAGALSAQLGIDPPFSLAKFVDEYNWLTLDAAWLIRKVWRRQYKRAMAWEVEVTNEFVQWFDGLSEREQDDVGAVIDLLAIEGVRLSRPQSASIAGARNSHMRELIVQSGGRPIRVFYAFDPRQTAIMLLGGDKAGVSDRVFYARYIRIADNLYDEYIAELEREGLL